MKRLTLWLALCSAAWLTGCGSSGSSSAGATNLTSGRTTQVRLTVAWPAASRVIPAETARIGVTVSGGDMAEVLEEDITRPDDGSDVSVSLLTVPIGADRLFSAIAWDASNQAVAVGSTRLAELTASDTPQPVDLELAAVDAAPAAVPNAPTVLGGGQIIRSASQPGRGQVALTGLVADGTALNTLTAAQFSLRQTLPDGRVVSLPISNFENLSNEFGGQLDVAFVLDTTMSMDPVIDGIRDSVVQFADTLGASGRDVRIGVISFGDDIDNQYRPWMDFSDDVAEVQEFVRALWIGEGGDPPENPLDAVAFAVNEFTWRPGADRVLLVVTDMLMHQPHDRLDYPSFAEHSLRDVLNLLDGQYKVYVVSPDHRDLIFRSAQRQSDQPSDGPVVPDAWEPQNDDRPGIPLVFGGPAVHASFHVERDYDYWSFEAPPGAQKVAFTIIAPPEKKVAMTLYTVDKYLLHSFLTRVPGEPTIMTWRASRPKYLIRVSSGDNNRLETFNYTVKVGYADEDNYYDYRTVPAKLLADETGGVWIPLPSDGHVDLNVLGVTSMINSGYRFTWPLLWAGQQLNRPHNLIAQVRDGATVKDIPLTGRF